MQSLVDIGRFADAMLDHVTVRADFPAKFAGRVGYELAVHHYAAVLLAGTATGIDGNGTEVFRGVWGLNHIAFLH